MLFCRILELEILTCLYLRCECMHHQAEGEKGVMNVTTVMKGARG